MDLFRIGDPGFSVFQTDLNAVAGAGGQADALAFLQLKTVYRSQLGKAGKQVFLQHGNVKGNHENPPCIVNFL